MRLFAALAVVGLGFGLLIPTQAQSFTYGTLVGGQVKSALAYGSGSSWCLVDNGNTEFQINQAGSKAVISFAEVIYFDGSTYYSLDGQTILTFSGPMSGTIHFKQTPTYPNPVHSPSFANFALTYTAATDQVVVSFNILFPNNCTLVRQEAGEIQPAKVRPR
jgi:hypothetical protein